MNDHSGDAGINRSQIVLKVGNTKSIGMKSKTVLFLLIMVLGLNSCENQQTANQQDKNTLTIAAAANVQFAMKEIEKAYEAATDTDITIIIGSSGKLTAQIKQGAPYDLLIAANMKYPESLYKDGFATATPAIYALGGLVLWTMKEEIDLDDQLTILKKKEVRKIAIANPKNAPYGEQAINAFKYFGMEASITPKLVYAESIAQTNQYTITKNCEIGITAKSVVTSPEMKGKGKWKDIPPVAYQPITQGVVITKYGAQNHPTTTKHFYDFLFSTEAGRIFEKYGYAVPEVE